MRGALAIVSLCAAGCDSLWGLQDVHGSLGDASRIDTPVDAAPICFMPRVMLQDVVGNADPTLRDDGKELFFVNDSSGLWDIWHATRIDLGAMFNTGSAVSELNMSSSEETDPALTADGLMIVFKSNRSGGFRAYQATRSTVTSMFSSPVMVPGISGFVSGLDLSPDGLTIYIDDGAKLNVATRAARTDPFGALMQLTIDRLGFPSASADGLQLFYNAAGVVRRTRIDLTAGFDGATAEVVDMGGSDADITPDGTRLVFRGNDRIVMRERCP